MLQSAQNLKNHGKDLYFENGKDYLQLCAYQATLEDYAFWENRHQFALLMLKNSTILSPDYIERLSRHTTHSK